jgi:trans-aconitate methyltransferase
MVAAALLARLYRKMTGRSEHWNQVYNTRAETDVGWYQPFPHLSLSIINSVASKDTPIIDIGGGASRLVDELLAVGYADLVVLDVSEAALARSRERLGVLADRVEWITSDITKWDPPRRWSVWHDRAVFHFLTE